MGMTKPAAVKITVHAVLAGAYRGRGLERALLTHASADGGRTSLCRKVKEWSLCDEEIDDAPACTVCKVRITRLRR